MQGNIGESPQIHFFNYREGTPMTMQGSPQCQSVRSDRQHPAPSDQGRLPIGALGGNPTQLTDHDKFSGSETSTANTAIQQQSSRGADLDIKSPQDVRYAMTAQVCRQLILL